MRAPHRQVTHRDGSTLSGKYGCAAPPRDACRLPTQEKPGVDRTGAKILVSCQRNLLAGTGSTAGPCRYLNSPEPSLSAANGISATIGRVRYLGLLLLLTTSEARVIPTMARA